LAGLQKIMGFVRRQSCARIVTRFTEPREPAGHTASEPPEVQMVVPTFDIVDALTPEARVPRFRVIRTVGRILGFRWVSRRRPS
jgi:hypothetical protein